MVGVDLGVDQGVDLGVDQGVDLGDGVRRSFVVEGGGRREGRGGRVRLRSPLPLKRSKGEDKMKW